MSDKPRRKFYLTAVVEADSLGDLIQRLNQIAEEIDENRIVAETAWFSLCGGYTGSHSVNVEVSPDMTHDEYRTRLMAYLVGMKKP